MLREDLALVADVSGSERQPAARIKALSVGGSADSAEQDTVLEQLGLAGNGLAERLGGAPRRLSRTSAVITNDWTRCERQ